MALNIAHHHEVMDKTPKEEPESRLSNRSGKDFIVSIDISESIELSEEEWDIFHGHLLKLQEQTANIAYRFLRQVIQGTE